MGKSAKLECMKSDKELFEQFQKLVERGKRLRIKVVLMEEKIELRRLGDDTEEGLAIGILEYSSAGQRALSDFMDFVTQKPDIKFKEARRLKEAYDQSKANDEKWGSLELDTLELSTLELESELN